MKVSSAALLAVAGVATTDAPEFLNKDFNVVAGQPFILEYSGCENGACAIYLQDYNDENHYIELIEHAPNGTVAVQFSGMTSGTYYFVLQKSGYNYAGPLFDYHSSQAGGTRGSLPASVYISPATPAPSSSAPTPYPKTSNTLTSSTTTTDGPSMAVTGSTTTTDASTPNSSTTTPSSLTGFYWPDDSSSAARKTGIVVGALGAGFIALCLATGWYLIRRRNARRRLRAQVDEDNAAQPPLLDSGPPRELPAHDSSWGERHGQVGGAQTPAELSGHSQPSPSFMRSTPNNEKRHMSYISSISGDYYGPPAKESLLNSVLYELDGQQPTEPTHASPQQHEVDCTQPSHVATTQDPPADPESIPKTAADQDAYGDAEQEPFAEPWMSGTQPADGAGEQELLLLERQYADLESRRQRILDLETIEREQAALRKRLTLLQGHTET